MRGIKKERGRAGGLEGERDCEIEKAKREIMALMGGWSQKKQARERLVNDIDKIRRLRGSIQRLLEERAFEALEERLER